MSVAYIGPKSRTERPTKTKIGPEVAHVTRDSDLTFKVKGQGHQAALVGCSNRHITYLDAILLLLLPFLSQAGTAKQSLWALTEHEIIVHRPAVFAVTHLTASQD